jgi:hypothetical protein
MTTGVRCPKCGAENQAQASSCRQCGTALPAARPGFDPLAELDQPARQGLYWKWVGIGVVLILVLQVAVGLTLAPWLAEYLFVELNWGLLAVFGTLLIISLAIYFVAGLIVGRLSSGFTVKEPALASMIAAAINWGLEYFVFRNVDTGIGYALVAMALCAALGAAGGSAGETWQNRTRAKRGKG